MTSADATALGILVLLVGRAAVVDIRRLIIPDTVNLAIFATGLAASLALGRVALVSALAAALLGGGTFLAVQAGFRAYRGFDGLGTGDVKFIAAGATWTGLEGLAPTLLVASLLALGYVGCRRSWHAGFDLGARIPFGPFLAVGVAVAAAAPICTGGSWFDLIDRIAP